MGLLRRVKKRFFAPQTGEHEADRSLVTAVFVLVGFGLVMLFSASSAISYARFGTTYHFFSHQLVALGVSLVFFFLASRIDYHWWKKFAVFFLFFSLVLLLTVFIPGLKAEIGTANSWTKIGSFTFQPSEIVKIAFLIYLATWLEAKSKMVGKFSEVFLPFLVFLAIIAGLLMAQPDLGTLLVILGTSFIVYFAGGGKIRHMVMVVALAVVALVFLLGSLSNYQSERLNCFRNPNRNTDSHCYQINQSLIAAGSGGWFGRGLGASRQKYMYLPEVWGDSIFPVIAEETGFVFSSLLVLLYLFVFYRGLLIARAAPDIYGYTLAVGVVSWLAIQAFINIGGMINLIPMTGVPLPFISAGGTAILANLIGIGILVNISKQTRKALR